MGIGDKLNELLEKRNRKTNELANTIGVSPQTLYSISKRNNTKVDLDILQKIADELSVTLDYFCSDSDEQNDSIILTTVEKNIVNTYRSLSDQGKEYILNQMEIAKNIYKNSDEGELSDREAN